MGYIVELNTLLALPKDFDTAMLKVGARYTITKPRERAFPLHLAVLVVDSEWCFYGYAVVHSAVIKNQETELEFEILSIFPANQREVYRENFLNAAKLTGELG